MPSEPNPFDAFSHDELDVLDDMIDNWSDKDGHGFLKSDYCYDADQLATFSRLYSQHYEAFKRKRG